MQENWGSEGKRRRLTALFLSFRKPITFYALTAAVAFRLGSNDPGIQHNGVDDLDHCGWTVGIRTKLYVRAVLDIVRGEDPRAALTAEQHDTLVEYSETVYNARPADRTAHLGKRIGCPHCTDRD